MAVWRFRLVLCALMALVLQENSAFGQATTEAPVAKLRPVPVLAYNANDQLTGSGWALPLNGAYVTVRSLLANAVRAELVLTEEMREAVEEVGGEDIEGNLVVVSVEASTPTHPVAGQSSVNRSDSPIGTTSSVSLFAEAADSGSREVTISCGTTAYPLRERQVRDIPVFGLVMLGETRHRDSIAGCPVLDADGALQAIVVWENPFGHPSAALVPAVRATQLSASPRKPWQEWRAAQQQPDLNLRNGLLSEALADIWREHYDLAQESLTFLLEKNPTDARGWYYRGYSRAMSGKRKLAIMDYENAVHFDPGNAEARFSLGFSYALVHRVPEAREQVAALEALDAASALRLRFLVDAMVESGHDDARAIEEPKPKGSEATPNDAAPQ